MRHALRLAVAALAILPLTASAQDVASWTRPMALFHIAGPIYYVGSEGIAAYLIKTSKGAILIDGTMPENVEMVARNIAATGTPLADVRYILLSHAHVDHAGGIAGLRERTGAAVITGAMDRKAMETGKPTDDNNYSGYPFPAAPVARVVRTGDVVQLGDVTLTAIETPGHTRGCTSWKMQVREGRAKRRVMFPCSLTVAGNWLVDNRDNPGIIADYRASFARMAAEKADIVLPAHPEFASVIERGRRKAAGERGAFFAPLQLRKLVAEARDAFEAELARQQKAGRPKGAK